MILKLIVMILLINLLLLNTKNFKFYHKKKLGNNFKVFYNLKQVSELL